MRAQAILAEKYGVQTDVWSVTSYNQLRREALGVERWNRLHPDSLKRPLTFLTRCKGAEGPIIAASDYMKIVPDQLAPWLSTRLVSLGTDGFGRSDNREYLRRHFEVNAESSWRQRFPGGARWKVRPGAGPGGIRGAGRGYGNG